MNLEINSTQAQLETGALDLASHKLEPHGGRLWATPNVPHGAVFQPVPPS